MSTDISDPTPTEPTPPPVNAPLSVAPPPAPPAAPPVPPVSGPIRQELAARGIPADSFDSDSDAMDALLGAAQAYEEGRQYIDIGRQAAPAWDDFQSWQKNKPGETPPANPAPTDDDWQWKSQQFDPAWHQHLDEFGRVRPDTNPVVAQRIAEYRNWESNASRELLQDPQKIIRRAIKKDLKSTQEGIRETIQREVQQALAAHAAEQRNEAFLNEQKKELFQLDDAGNERIDPNTGQVLMTAKGRAFQAHARQADQFGITHPDAKREFIAAKLAADTAAGKFGNGQPAPPTPPAPPQATRESFLQEALAGPPGTLPASPMDGTIPRSPHEPVAGMPKSIRELTEEVLREYGDIP